MKQDKNGIPFVKITFHDKGLLKNTDKVEIVWDIGQESFQTLNKRSKLQIPYSGESINDIKGSKSVKFIDEDRTILYETKII